MPRNPASFRQSDVTRALKGAMAAGFDVKRCEIDRNGRIVIASNDPAPVVVDEPKSENPWDAL
jgi:hypothetical protein